MKQSIKSVILASLTAALLAACGAGDNSADGSVSAQSKLQRTTKTVATAPTAASFQDQVQSLYIAYFGRPADPAGLANFEAQLVAAGAPATVYDMAQAYSTNAALKTLIDSFGTSAESQKLYAGANNTAFVTAIFQNVLGRAPAASGLQFWVDGLNGGGVTQGDVALAIMGAAQVNTTPQGVLDGQLIASRITAAEYFTTQVEAQLDNSAYTGSIAAADARSMLAQVTATTNLTSFQATESATIAALPNQPFYRGTASTYNGKGFLQYTTGGTAAVYDAAGNEYTIDAASYELVSAADNVYLNGLVVDPTNTDWYLLENGSIIGIFADVSGPNGAAVLGMYYTGNNQFGQLQINPSTSAYTLGCTGACVSNTSTSSTPVALQEIDTTVGTGATALYGHTVTVNYAGYLYNAGAANFEGMEFDSSAAHGTTFSFTLGAGSVIAGWDIGVQGMKVGGTRTLIIPSLLGYGATANGPIPANSGLVFTVQLVSVQ